MNRHGIINAPLSGHLARPGHTDLVVAADAGLPVAAHVPVVDLALVHGRPTFTSVLDALVAEVVFEHAWVSAPADDWPVGAWVDERLDAPGEARDPHGRGRGGLRREPSRQGALRGVTRLRSAARDAPTSASGRCRAVHRSARPALARSLALAGGSRHVDESLGQLG